MRLSFSFSGKRDERMARPRITAVKRQREQAKRERQQRKVERREDRKRQEVEGATAAEPDGSGSPA
jgi:hypothetical protein